MLERKKNIFISQVHFTFESLSHKTMFSVLKGAVNHWTESPFRVFNFFQSPKICSQTELGSFRQYVSAFSSVLAEVS